MDAKKLESLAEHIIESVRYADDDTEYDDILVIAEGNKRRIKALLTRAIEEETQALRAQVAELGDVMRDMKQFIENGVEHRP